MQASCTAGQLSGPLEFWAFGVSITGVDERIRFSRELSHTTTVMGKQCGPLMCFRQGEVVKINPCDVN